MNNLEEVMDEDLFNLAFLGLLPGELPRRDREVTKHTHWINVYVLYVSLALSPVLRAECHHPRGVDAR